MKIKIILILLIFPAFFFCQTKTIKIVKEVEKRKASPIFIFLIKAFDEIDHPFSFKRANENKSYEYNTGIGSTVFIPLYVKRKLVLGAETGGWYFWNNNVDINNQNLSFKKRDIVIPAMVSGTYPLIGGKNFGVGLLFSGGIAYDQKIKKYSNISISNVSSWKSVFSFSIKISFSTSSRLDMLSLGTGNAYIGPKNFRTAGFALPVFIAGSKIYY